MGQCTLECSEVRIWVTYQALCLVKRVSRRNFHICGNNRRRNDKVTIKVLLRLTSDIANIPFWVIRGTLRDLVIVLSRQLLKSFLLPRLNYGTNTLVVFHFQVFYQNIHKILWFHFSLPPLPSNVSTFRTLQNNHMVIFCGFVVNSGHSGAMGLLNGASENVLLLLHVPSLPGCRSFSSIHWFSPWSKINRYWASGIYAYECIIIMEAQKSHDDDAPSRWTHSISRDKVIVRIYQTWNLWIYT